MTGEEFIVELESKGYSYSISIGGNIIVKGADSVFLQTITSLPSGVTFKNIFDVYLDSVTNISPGVRFENGWNVIMRSIENIPPGVSFDNRGDIYLDSLIKGGFLRNWEGNIEGINYKRLINKMISIGLFDKKR
jgi:hypothetical protein